MTLPRGRDRPPGDLTPTLVLRLRDGNPDAATLLENLYRKRLIRFCLGYLHNREEAEDIVQDVFYRVLETTVVPEHFRAWIYEICRNRCVDRLRSQDRRPDDEPILTSDYFMAHLTGPLSRLIKGERQARLWERFASLPADQREVLLLRYTEGLSRAEISRVLGIPEKLVKHRIYNGLTRLREHESLADGP